MLLLISKCGPALPEHYTECTINLCGAHLRLYLIHNKHRLDLRNGAILCQAHSALLECRKGIFSRHICVSPSQFCLQAQEIGCFGFHFAGLKNGTLFQLGMRSMHNSDLISCWAAMLHPSVIWILQGPQHFDVPCTCYFPAYLKHLNS
jgi:hypothetical protein